VDKRYKERREKLKRKSEREIIVDKGDRTEREKRE
jgi:hypothetical protein